MKISYSWIKELVDIKTTPEKLGDALSMAGLSVAFLEKTANDWVYDIEVTSNRPDWLSVRGIVHEISAIMGVKLKKPLATSHKPRAKNKISMKPAACSLQPVSITIENTKDCKFYYGNVIAGVKVGLSPEWLKVKLETLGFRSINNIVDITNFCLLELGQPLHAFDYDKIVSQLAGYPANQLINIVVRRAKEGEEIVTIDGINRKLKIDTLVVALGGDKIGKPLAVAGIMGGALTEVSDKTKNIILESACFDPVIVRRGSRALGITSDSSYRFERGVDEVTVKEALTRATKLICELCGGELVESKRAGILKERGKRKITFDLSKGMDLLGVTIPAARAKSIFQKLGFGVKERAENIFEITVPSFRRDVSIAEDLTEELVRVWGYEFIPLTSPAIKPFQMEKPVIELLKERAKEILIGAGLKEIVTYSLIGESDYQKTGLCAPDGARTLVNPLSQENSILRTTLLPSLLNCVSFNVSRNNRDIELFETARVFGNNKEESVAAFALCGKRSASWLKEAVNYTLFDLKGLIEILFEGVGIKNCSYQSDDSLPFAEQGTGCRVIFKNEILAVFCQISSAVKKAWGIKAKEDIFVAEVQLERISRCANLKKCFSTLVTFPGIVRDISILASEDAPYERIKSLIETEARGLVRRVAVVETYQGKEIQKGSLSLTISIEYGSPQRTLTDEEVNLAHQKVLEALTTGLGVKIR